VYFNHQDFHILIILQLAFDLFATAVGYFKASLYESFCIAHVFIFLSHQGENVKVKVQLYLTGFG